jgi:hypothetical protein
MRIFYDGEQFYTDGHRASRVVLVTRRSGAARESRLGQMLHGLHNFALYPGAVSSNIFSGGKLGTQLRLDNRSFRANVLVRSILRLVVD